MTMEWSFWHQVGQNDAKGGLSVYIPLKGWHLSENGKAYAQGYKEGQMKELLEGNPNGTINS